MDPNFQGIMVMNLFDILAKQSSLNTINPDPNAQSQPGSGQLPGHVRRRERAYVIEEFLGIIPQMGRLDSALELDGELIRTRQYTSILCGGCGHIVQVQDRDKPEKSLRVVEGICQFCEEAYVKVYQNNNSLITPEEIHRRSLVCSDCAKITESGTLCCPNHYAKVKDDEGKSQYLDPNDQEEQDRKQVVQGILTPFLSLFGENEVTQNDNPPPQIIVIKGDVNDKHK